MGRTSGFCGCYWSKTLLCHCLCRWRARNFLRPSYFHQVFKLDLKMDFSYKFSENMWRTTIIQKFLRSYVNDNRSASKASVGEHFLSFTWNLHKLSPINRLLNDLIMFAWPRSVRLFIESWKSVFAIPQFIGLMRSTGHVSKSGTWSGRTPHAVSFFCFYESDH